MSLRQRFLKDVHVYCKTGKFRDMKISGFFTISNFVTGKIFVNRKFSRIHRKLWNLWSAEISCFTVYLHVANSCHDLYYISDRGFNKKQYASSLRGLDCLVGKGWDVMTWITGLIANYFGSGNPIYSAQKEASRTHSLKRLMKSYKEIYMSNNIQV